MATPYSIDHQLSDVDAHIHSVFDNELDPVLTIDSGDIVQFECRDTVDGQIDSETSAEDIPHLDLEPIHPLTGPVYIEEATPGDVLAIEFLSIEHHGWGYNFCLPGESGMGLLPEEFEDPAFHFWELDEDVGYFVDGIEVPLHPFPGIAGVAPAEDGEHTTIPPRRVGGNMDIKHLTEGSTLYLPVECDGGLFSIGDCHAAQGDGEVSITGIEAPMTVTARFAVRPDMAITQPQFECDHPFTPTGRDEPMYGTAGIAPDLMDATKRALLYMIDHIEAEHGLSRESAYLLCSAVVDLKINQVVDAPNWTVSAYLPQSIFPDAG